MSLFEQWWLSLVGNEEFDYIDDIDGELAKRLARDTWDAAVAKMREIRQ